MKTTRYATGCYRTLDGAYEMRSDAFHSEGESLGKGWHLFDLRLIAQGRDGYCNTFPSKAAAVGALEEAQAEGSY